MNIKILIKTLPYRILIFSFLTFLLASCKNIDLENIDDDLNNFMDWALSDTVIQSNQIHSTISSFTSSAMRVKQLSYL